MASGPLEEARALHEDMERLERLVVADYKAHDGATLTHLARLAQAHRVKRRLDAIQRGANKLLRLYEDADGARKEEIAALAGGSAAQRERLLAQYQQQQRQQEQQQEGAYPPPPPPQQQPQENGAGDGAAAPDAAAADEQQQEDKEEDKEEEEEAADGKDEAAAAEGEAKEEEKEEQQQQQDGGGGDDDEKPKADADGNGAAAAAANAAMEGVDEEQQQAPPPPPPPRPYPLPPPPPRPMPAFSAPTPSLAAFYARLTEVRSYHDRFPSRDVTRDESEVEAAAVRELPQVPFSGEEARGRCVDLHALHAEFLNVEASAAAAAAAASASAGAPPPGDKQQEAEAKEGQAKTEQQPPPPPPLPPMDYLAFLDALREWGSGGPDGFPVGGTRALPRARRLAQPWRAWCSQLESYLRSFHERTRPLTPLEARLARVEEELREAWAKGQMPVGWQGWQQQEGAVGGGGGGGGANAKKPPPPAATTTTTTTKGEIDVDAYESPQQLADAVGGDALKRDLAARGLKIGGTPLQRAERLWAAAGKATPAAAAAAGGGGGGNPPKRNRKKGGGAAARHEQRALDSALCEARVRWLLGALTPEIQATRARAERRAALTAAELEAEAAEEEAADEAELRALAAGDLEAAAAANRPGISGADQDDEDERNARLHNPLRLPLGWDGRPIPYWLFKLHGLNHEFRCEICGGHSYWGRREYERHFREARHASGMRALGLPNTKEFFEVTRVEDALALGKELEERRRRGGGGSAGGGGGGAAGGFEEELEDAQGNVFDRRTYELLARQGLV